MSLDEFGGLRARLLCGAGLVAVNLTLTATAALGQQLASNQVENVVVTGSRLSVANPFEAPTPVTVIGTQDIQLSGTANIETLLNQSPQFVGSTNGSASSNTQQANGASGGAYINLRGLGEVRSLVLVDGKRFTINGTNQTTDLNTVPTALIDRTEIVTGGSSAVYGSDAIAGVINFIMKKDFSGAQLDLHTNFDSYTLSPTYNVDITVGSNFANDRGNVEVSMDYLNRPGIEQKQVSYAANPLNESCVTPSSWSRTLPATANGAAAANCATSGGIMGFTAGGSTSTPTGQFIPVFTGSDATLTSLYAAAGLAGIGGAGFTFNNAGTTARLVNNPADLYNTTALNFMQIPQERWMINAFAHYDITPYITAYADMHFSNNAVTVQLTPSNLGGQSILVNTNNPYLSPAMDAVLVRLDQLEVGTTNIVEGSKTFTTTPGDNLAIVKMSRRFVELGNRVDADNRAAWRFAGGFRGNVGSVSDDFLKDLSYDIYYDYARTIDTNFLNGVGSRSAIQNAILSQGGQAPVCDVFGQAMSSACVTAVSITDSYTTKAEQAGAVATVTGTAFDLPAGPVAFVLGGEWRFDSAQYIPDPYLATGEPTGFNGSLPTRGSESVKEVFGEVRVPVIANVPLIDKFTVNGAFRNSSYNLSGVGSVWTYSAGADWKVVDDIAFRGQFQHAIRAPNVGELYGGTALNFQSNTIDPCGGNQPAALQTATLRAQCVATGVPSGNVFTTVVQDASKLVGFQTGGNPNLKAEASDTITFGAVLTPSFIPGLSASIDYYSVDVKGAIATFGGSAQGVLNNCYADSNPSDPNCLAIHRDSSGAIAAPTYINLGQTNLNSLKVEGVDYEVDYNYEIGWGWLSDKSTLTFGSNWAQTLENISTPSTPGSPTTNCLGAFGGTCGEPIPRWKGASRLTWNTGPLSVSVRWRFIDSVTDDRYLLPLRSGVGVVAPLNTLTNPVFPVYNYFDLSGIYDLNQNLRLTAGINNLFDLTPPVTVKAGYGNTWPSTYDAFGQTFFFSVTARMD
jgi:outer membrane receptor protein involved in Fe transport